MKGRLSLFFLGLTGAALLFSGCAQDPIFYSISREHAPTTARFPGSPTDIVPFAGGVYAASSTLQRYAGGAWAPVSKPDGKIVNIAATDNYLYALCFTGTTPDSAVLSRLEASGWRKVGDSALGSYRNLQTIKSDKNALGKRLFVGAWNGGDSASPGNYAIFYVDESSNSLILLQPGTALLTGAAFDGTNHFLVTAGTGAYKFDGSTSSQIISSINYSGVISLGTQIIGIARGGALHNFTGATGLVDLGNVGHSSTGALASCSTGGGNLLLVGFQGSVNSNGYGEIPLAGAALAGVSVNSPGMTLPSSMQQGQYEEYLSSIGKYPVNYIFQAPDSILFASTQQDGLWSYRIRSGSWQWNAEE